MSLEILMPKSPEKFVYVIGPSDGPFKIGIADDVKSRRSILNVGNPEYLRIWHYHEAASEAEAKEIETELHHHYQASHIRGEWFQLREADLPNIKQTLLNVTFLKCAPEGWTIERKSCNEFTSEVCVKARGALGLTQKQLAEKACISEATLRNFESHTATPQLDTLESLRSALETAGIEFVREQIGAPLKIRI
jgi:DNA-binding XRE family transcriptional regulator